MKLKCMRCGGDKFLWDGTMNHYQEPCFQCYGTGKVSLFTYIDMYWRRLRGRLTGSR